MTRRLRALALVALCTACQVPPYDPIGKPCDEDHACPGNLICLGGACSRPCRPIADACAGAERPCITTLAGSRGLGLADGPPETARFRGPTHLLALPEGALVVADSDNHALRKIPLDGGAVTTIAGDGTCVVDDPKAVCEPHGLALGSNGEIFAAVLDAIVRVDPNGNVTRIAGNGLPGPLTRPEGVAFADGRVIVTDTRNTRLRFYDRTGQQARDDAGTVLPSFSGCMTLGGQTLTWVETLAVSPNRQTLYYGDDTIICSVPLTFGLPSGMGRQVAGFDDGFLDGAPTNAHFDEPTQLAVSDTDVWIADQNNHRVRRWQLAGNVTTAAGTGKRGLSDGPTSGENPALLDSPTGVAAVGAAVYFTSPTDGRVRKIENGEVTTIAGGADPSRADACADTVELAAPGGIDVDPADGTIYFTDTLHHAVRALRPDGAVVTLAGGPPGSREGTFAEARFSSPRALKVRPDRTIVVSDEGNGAIVLLDPATKKVTILAGRQHAPTFELPSCNPELLNPPKMATLCAPKGLAVAANGDIWFVDSAEPGQGVVGRLSADGTRLDAIVDKYFYPRAIALGPGGHFAVSDLYMNEVAEYDAQGVVVRTLLPGDACDESSQHWERECVATNLAWSGADLLVLYEGAGVVRMRPASGAGATQLIAGTLFERGWSDGHARVLMSRPLAMSLMADGSILVADTGNHRLRRIWP